MSDTTRSGGFSDRRSRGFSRIGAYILFLLFLVSLAPAFLPFPAADPARLLASLRELLERSTLPLVGLIFLYQGFSAPALPALWECRLARLLRPLSGLAALLYLLSSVALVGIAHRIQADGLRQLDQQREANRGALTLLRSQIRATASSTELRQLLEQQPLFRAVLGTNESPLADLSAPLPAQRGRADALLDRVEANVRADDLRRRADAAGNLLKEQVRLVLTALIYAVFHALAWLIWPRSLATLLDQVRQARADALAEA